VKELLVTNFPKDAERAFHVGFDISQVEEGRLIFYIINLLPPIPVIQKFVHVPGQRSIKFIKTLPVPVSSEWMSAGPYAPNPNDVYIIPGTNAEQIFVTNDHATKPDDTGLSRKLEDYGRQKKSWISSYSEVDGTWKLAGKDATGLRLVNGITGPRYDKDRHFVYVSELGDGQVLVYKRVLDTATGRWGLELKQKVPVDFMGDNPTLSYPDEEDLYITGHPSPLNIKKHMMLALEPEKQPTSGGRASRFATSQVERGFFGTRGETAAPTVESLFVDPNGVMFNVSSTAVFYKHPVEEGEKEVKDDADAAEEVEDAELDVGVGNLRKGDLFVTGLLQKGIWRCKDFPA
jgi:hypothetical protein